MKNILKLKKNNNEVNETEKVEGTEEEVVMKPKWGLKKKLAIGGGLLALAVGGLVTLYNKGKESTNESCDNDEDDNDEDFDDDEVENEVENEVTIES